MCFPADVGPLSRRMTEWTSRLASWMATAATLCALAVAADDAADVKAAKPPLGQFLTVTSPIDDRMVARISNVAQKLQHQAVREQREAVLVLELSPGTSGFHHVQALSRALTSNQLSQV